MQARTLHSEGRTTRAAQEQELPSSQGKGPSSHTRKWPTWHPVIRVTAIISAGSYSFAVGTMEIMVELQSGPSPTAGGVGYLHHASGYDYIKKTRLGSERTVTEMGGWAEAWQGVLCSGSGAQHFTELVI